MDAASLVDVSPLVRVALLGAVLALGPLAWIWLRHRGAAPAARRRALIALTLFLTFDLVLFGAFTRLTDSGLGCPDWPGCYGAASPIGAKEPIAAAHAALPSGPVSPRKAWIEMLHRYLATAVGVLIIVIAATGIIDARGGTGHWRSAWLAVATLAWVSLQGAFGALTVTMKLQPAIVTLHLLGGMGLLALLAWQAAPRERPLAAWRRSWRAAVLAVAVLLAVQIALGGWVSSNYAVLACTDFPRCHGSWWPQMDFRAGFAPWRALGRGADGEYLPFPALTAIHYTHRLAAYAVLAAIVVLAIGLARDRHGGPATRRFAAAFAGLAAFQLATGWSNVVLGWPLLAAVLHTGGAAALVIVLTTLAARMPGSRAGS